MFEAHWRKIMDKELGTNDELEIRTRTVAVDVGYCIACPVSSS